MTKNCFFEQKVKIKLVSEDTSDGKEIEVEIKAKDEYVSYTEDEENFKFTIKVKDNQAMSKSFYLNSTMRR